MATRTRTGQGTEPTKPEAEAPQADWAAQLHTVMRAPTAAERQDGITKLRSAMRDAVTDHHARMSELDVAADAALLESVSAYEENRRERERLQTQIMLLASLEKAAAVAYEKARDDTIDEDIRAFWKRHASTYAAAHAAAVQYEQIATKLVPLLEKIREGNEVLNNLQREIERPYDRGIRTYEWVSAMWRELGNGLPKPPGDVERVGTLDTLVQLPAVTKVEPFWGKIYGNPFESTAEFFAKEAEKETAKAAPTPIAAGVYDGAGNRISLGHAAYEPGSTAGMYDGKGNRIEPGAREYTTSADSSMQQANA